ncbi:MAG: glycosyltransferase family 1 protein [Candidatus Pacebacteria bacterium]|nr:glycosyltransferase family 1 protein [Candidatus Paceibacterota bacterium]
MLVELVRTYNPKYLFAQKGEHIYPETIERIKTMGVVTLNFYNDQMNQWNVISKIAPSYNYFFNECHLVLRRLWSECALTNCFYLAHSAEPLTEDLLVTDKKYPISFIGTHNKTLYPKRERYLMAIRDLGLNIWGTDGWAASPLKDCFRGRSRGEERFAIYANSKIVIDINYEFVPAEGVNNRPFEVAGCGTLLVTDYVRKDLEREYSSGVEVVQFKDEAELREKVKYYLDHDDERLKVAMAGYRRTVADHTYDRRVAQIFDTMQHPQNYLFQ